MRAVEWTAWARADLLEIVDYISDDNPDAAQHLKDELQGKRHACLRYVQRDDMTIATLRERFGITVQDSATASHLIKEAVDAEMLRPYDESAGRKYIKYVPYWLVYLMTYFPAPASAAYQQ